MAALLLCAVLLLCAMGADAAERTVTASGTCGTNVSWELYDDGDMVIKGTGKMKDYSTSGAPWYSYRSSITSVTINNGVKSIGSFAFYDCSSMTDVTMPESLTSIGSKAFYNCSGLTSLMIPDGVTKIAAMRSTTAPPSGTSCFRRTWKNRALDSLSAVVN